MYQLRGRLGRWGFGELYEAIHSETGAHRMLKVVRGRRASDPHIHAHMVHEFEVAGCCSHPHLVAIEAMEEDPVIGIYHVMALVRGETLGAAFKRGLTFTPNKIVEIVGNVVAGLALLEANGHAHHEFCPETVYLPVQGPSPWVVSFGLPPAAESHPPLPLEALAYAAPERKAAQVWDNRADVYSVCAVLLQLLVGRPPPPQGWIQFPRASVTSELGEGLYDVAKRGLNPTPGQRYPSMEALFGAIRFLAESHGVQLALPESSGRPVRPRRPAPKRTVLGMSALTSPGESVPRSSQGLPPPPPVAVVSRDARPAKPAKAPTRPKIPSGRGRPSEGGMKKTVLGMGVVTDADHQASPGPVGAAGQARRASGEAAESGSVPVDRSADMALSMFDQESGDGLQGALSLEGLGDAHGATPLDEISLPADESSGAGGHAPLEPDAFPGAETGAHASFDPSMVSELPLPDSRRRKKLAVLGLAGGLGFGVVVLVLLFVWPGFVRKNSTGSAGGSPVLDRKRPSRSPNGARPRVAEARSRASAREIPARGSGPESGPGGVAGPGSPDAGTRGRADAGRSGPGPDAAAEGMESRPQATSRYKQALSEGRKALRHHKYALARRFFTKAHHLRPRSVTPMRLMARAHYRAHEYPAARFWYEKALKLSPRSASLHAQLGRVYGKLGKRSKACRHFVKALFLRPNSKRYRMAVENYRCSH